MQKRKKQNFLYGEKLSQKHLWRKDKYNLDKFMDF